MTSTAAHLAREALVSAAINALISLGFFYAFFRGVDPIPVSGMGNFAADFLPQSFAVSLMSALVPGFLARKAIQAGRFPGAPVPRAGRIVARALGWALVGLAAGCAIAALLVLTGAHATIAAGPALATKIVYGAALGALITYRSVARLIVDRRSAA